MLFALQAVTEATPIALQGFVSHRLSGCKHVFVHCESLTLALVVFVMILLPHASAAHQHIVLDQYNDVFVGLSAPFYTLPTMLTVNVTLK